MHAGKQYIEQALKKNPFSPLWQVICSYLKREIITLRLAPGERLLESRIAQQLDVSRSPVRRAIEELVQEGLVTEEAGRYEVSGITKPDLQHLAYARLEIDGEAARVAARHINETELAQLKRLLNRFKNFTEDSSFYQFAIVDDQFHAIIYQACRNPYLQGMYAVLRPRLLRYRYYSMAVYPDRKELVKDTYICHGSIYYALEKHLSEMAKAEVQQDAARMPDTIALIPNSLNFDIFREIDNSALHL